MEKTYSHKLRSAASSIGESSSMSIPSYVLAESRVLEIVASVWRGFNTSSKSWASLSNAKIWRLDEWAALIEEPGWNTILEGWPHQDRGIEKK